MASVGENRLLIDQFIELTEYDDTPLPHHGKGHGTRNNRLCIGFASVHDVEVEALRRGIDRGSDECVDNIIDKKVLLAVQKIYGGELFTAKLRQQLLVCMRVGLGC